MASETINRQLNGILIQMSKSFLQYVSEASLWTHSQDIDKGNLVDELAEIQRLDTGELAKFLSSCDHSIDFGTFPTEYTDLQFLALEAMLTSLIHGQRQICAALRELCNAIPPEESVVMGLVNQILENQSEILRRLDAIPTAS